jgi:hypothetical protein
MAPKNFVNYFNRLPIELRLRIWNLTMEPRLICAKWENHIYHDDIVHDYALTAGPVPSALHVCKESRQEAKRKYCLVKSHLPLTEGMKARLPFSARSIWINFAIDTLYFVNLCAMPNFISYLRRLSKKRVGGANKNIKYIGIPACVLDRIVVPRAGQPNRLLHFYRLVVEVPSVEKIIIMLDNSRFEDDKNPDHYSLSRPYALSQNGRGGGKWGNSKVRGKMSAMFDDFFTNLKEDGMEIELFKKYTKDNPEWPLPSFTMLSVRKTAKHDYASDGLPTDKIPEKPIPSKPKPPKIVV